MNLQRILQDTLEIEQLMAEKKVSQLEEEEAGQEARQGEEQGEGDKEVGRKKLNGGSGGASARKKLVS